MSNKLLYFPSKIRNSPIGDGTQKLYRFDNGYGASVMRYIAPGEHSMGYHDGLWELCILQYDPDGRYHVVSHPDIAESGTLGFLREADVQEILKMIVKLPKVGTAEAYALLT
jgi:hypothetical protein